jgi:hypothetical protein
MESGFRHKIFVIAANERNKGKAVNENHTMMIEIEKVYEKEERKQKRRKKFCNRRGLNRRPPEHSIRAEPI